MKTGWFIFIPIWMIASLSISAQTVSAPPLLASREELNQFFTTYVERYNQKDIEGLLSLFSLKAIQNKKESLDAIRKIYIDFFNQSHELRYRIEELRQEIYENAVEVKARYMINQVLKPSGKERMWIGHVRWVLVKEGGALKILSLDYQHEKVP